MYKNIQNRLNDYTCEHETSEVGIPLVIIAEILMGIENELKNITNKLD